MFKQILLLTFVLAISVSATNQLLLGTDGKNKFTLTYIELSEDEALRVRYNMLREQPLGFDRIAAAICCTEGITYPTDSTTGNTDTPSNDTPTDTPGTDTPSSDTNGRNLQDSTPIDPTTNIGKCFGMTFTCGIQGGCSGATQFGTVLYQSTIVNGEWQAASNDFSSKNVGSVNKGTGTDFTTRFGFNQEEAEQTSIPLVGTNYTTTLGCYTAYDIPRSQGQLNTKIKLQNSTSWNYNQNVTVQVAEDELAPEEEVSGAFTQFLSIGVVGILIATFTIL